MVSKLLQTKGQIISKGFFGVLEFSQKTNERIRRSSKVFLGEFEDSKSPFEIIWPLAILNIFIRLQFNEIFIIDLSYLRLNLTNLIAKMQKN